MRNKSIKAFRILADSAGGRNSLVHPGLDRDVFNWMMCHKWMKIVAATVIVVIEVQFEAMTVLISQVRFDVRYSSLGVCLFSHFWFTKLNCTTGMHLGIRIIHQTNTLKHFLNVYANLWVIDDIIDDTIAFCDRLVLLLETLNKSRRMRFWKDYRCR